MLLIVGAAGALEVQLLLLDFDLGVFAVLQADREEDQVCPLRPLHERGDHAGPEGEPKTLQGVPLIRPTDFRLSRLYGYPLVVPMYSNYAGI